MQFFQPPFHLNKYPPDIVLVEECMILLMIYDLLVDIAIRSVLHHDVQALLIVLYERLLVPYHVRMPNRRKYSHLVERILSLLLAQRAHVHLQSL